MITEHTRVEMRVLCALSHGGSATEDRPGQFFTDKLNGVRCCFSADLFERLTTAGYIDAAGAITQAGRDYVASVRAAAEAVLAHVHGVASGQALELAHDLAGEHADEAAVVSAARACNPSDLAAVIREAGFDRPGMGRADCCLAASRILHVIDRLGPKGVVSNG